MPQVFIERIPGTQRAPCGAGLQGRPGAATHPSGLRRPEGCWLPHVLLSV